MTNLKGIHCYSTFGQVLIRTERLTGIKQHQHMHDGCTGDENDDDHDDEDDAFTSLKTHGCGSINICYQLYIEQHSLSQIN